MSIKSIGPRIAAEPLEPRRLLAASLVYDFTQVGVVPHHITAVGERVYFSGESERHGRELWVSNGTRAGTRMVVDLSPGEYGTGIFKILDDRRGGAYVFASTQEAYVSLYHTKGTVKTTKFLAEFSYAQGYSSSEDPIRDAHVLTNGTLVFTPYNIGAGLWRSDGTAKGTYRIGNRGWALKFASTAAGDRFVGVLGDGRDPDHRDDRDKLPALYVSDGTEKGTGPLAASGLAATIVSAQRSTLYVTGYDAKAKVARVVAYDGKNARVDILSGAHGATVFGGEGLRNAFGLHLQPDGSITFSRVESDSARRIDSSAAGTLNPVRVALDRGPKHDYFLTRNESGGPLRLFRVDDASLKLVPAGTFSIGASKKLRLVNLESVGDGFFVVGEIDGERRYYELDARRGAADQIGQIALTKKQSNDLAHVGAVAGGRFYFGSSDLGRPADLFSKRPGEAIVSLSPMNGGAESSVIRDHAQMAGGRFVAMHAWTARDAASHLDVHLIEADGTRRTLARSAAFAVDARYDPQDGQAARIVPDAEGGVVVAFQFSDWREVDSKPRTLLLYVRADGRASAPHVVEGRATVLGASAGTAFVLGLPNGRKMSHALESFTFVDGSATPVHTRYLTTNGKAPADLPAYKPAGGLQTDRTSIAFAGGRMAYVDAQGYASVAVPGSKNTSARVYRPLRTERTVYAAIAVNGRFFYGNRDGIWRVDDSLDADVHADRNTIGAEYLSISGSSDGKSIHVVAGGDRWTLGRISADRAKWTPLVRQPARWSHGAPVLIGGRGDDVLFASRHATASAMSVNVALGGQLDAALQLQAGDVEAISIVGGALNVHRDSRGGHDVLRIRNGQARSVPIVPRDAAQVRVGERGVSFMSKTPATGTELFEHRWDTTISGVVYGDLNANQSFEAGERGLAGWRVYVDRNDDGRWNKNEPFVMTDSTGKFEFFELPPGNYKLRVSTGPNHAMTTGTSYGVKLAAGQNVTKRFGARPIQ